MTEMTYRIETRTIHIPFSIAIASSCSIFSLSDFYLNRKAKIRVAHYTFHYNFRSEICGIEFETLVNYVELTCPIFS